MQRQFYLFLLLPFFTFAQINPQDVEIVRDNFGVPHIFGKTDADVAYGLAWAHAEDDFKTIQQGYLAGNALLGKHIGTKGAGADFIAQFIGSKEIIERSMIKKLAPNIKKLQRPMPRRLINMQKHIQKRF